MNAIEWLRMLEGVFGWLLAASWQASVLALLVLALQTLLRGRLNPRWRYALWLLVVLRLVLPALPESALSLFQFAPTPAPALLRPVTEPLFTPIAPTSPAVAAPSSEPARPLTVYSLLALGWLAGALVLFGLTWEANRRFARQVARSPEITDPLLLDLFLAAKAELGVRRSIRLVESRQVQSPAIMGLFSPTLLLPAGVRDRFDATELRLIFLHELAHLKRGDVIVQGLIALLQILHWFNPVLWYAFRRMRLDREPATDALVLSQAGEGEKERYGLMLIKLLENFNQRHSLPTLVGILEDKDQFKRRFSLIARFTRGAYGWSLLGVLLIGILAVACLTKSKSTTSPNDTKASSKTGSEQAKLNGEQLIDAVAREDIPEMSRLLKLGTDVNFRGKDDWTPITKAAASGKVASVQFLLAHGADPNSVKKNWDYSALCLAKKPEIADMLLAAGGKIDASRFMHYGVMFGFPEKVEWLIAHGVDPTKMQGHNPDETLLFDAGSPEVAEILIQHGADVNARAKNGETAIESICFENAKPAEIARVLLKHGADPNARNDNGSTPLMYAYDGATVDVLVEYGADVKAKNKHGDGVIGNARGDASRLQALIRHGAPFDPKTDGPTMMMDAAWRDHVDVIASLLSLGVDPNLKGTWNKEANMYFTPLQESVTSGHLDAAKFLLDHGAKVEPRVIDGKPGPDEMVGALYNRRQDIVQLFWESGIRSISELTYAISQGEPVGAVQKLLDNGIPPNPPQDKFISPLTLAAELGQLDVVTLLVQRGAKIDGLGALSEPPLDQAATEGQDEVVDYLLHHGAQVDYQALWNAVWNSHPYEDQRSKDHFERTVKLLIDAGTLKNITPEQSGQILSAAIDTRYPGGNATVLKMLMEAGLSPKLPLTDRSGKKVNSVIGYYRDLYAKGKDTNNLVSDIKPMLDMLAASEKGVKPEADTPTPNSTETEPPTGKNADESTNAADHAAAPSSQQIEQIIDAVKKDDGVSLAKLVDGVDVGKIQDGDEPLLFDALSAEVVKILLEHGADANMCDKLGRTALIRLNRHGDKNAVPIARVLLDHGADPNARWGDNGDVPLFRVWDSAMVDLLIAHGADPKLKSNSGSDALDYVGIWLDPSVFDALIRGGVPFNVQTNGPDKLVHASNYGNTPLMAKLLALGVDPNTPGAWVPGVPKDEFMSPLAAAVNSGVVSAVALLLDHGAKAEGDKAKIMVIAVEHQPQNRAIAKLLWDRGNRDVSPLLYAISQGASVQEIAKLLDAGSPSDPPQDVVLTPLGYVAKKGNLDVVKLLVARGADVNKGGFHNTIGDSDAPVALAAFEGRDEVVGYLLAHGAKPDPAALCEAAHNSTPYGNERTHDHFEKTVRLLLDAGALKNVTPEQEGVIVNAPIWTRQGPPNATVLKMILDAGGNPNAPMPFTKENGEKPNTVIGFYRDYCAQHKEDPAFGTGWEKIIPLLDMLEAADKGASTNPNTLSPADRTYTGV